MIDKIIDGKEISRQIKDEVRNEVNSIKSNGGRVKLAVVVVDGNKASQIYAINNRKSCEKVGIETITIELPNNVEESQLIEEIEILNERKDVNGILVHVPLPKHINEEKVLQKINPKKDMDGFHPYNIGMLSLGKPIFKPCTPAGVIELIKRMNIEIIGKNCVVIGRSNIVGKPISMLLLEEHGTVSICHSKSEDLERICTEADILIAAVGRPKFIKSNMIKEGATVIDVGIHRLQDNSICGDVDFNDCKTKAGLITPVPGGVGPMTIAMLMQNCVRAYRKQNI